MKTVKASFQKNRLKLKQNAYLFEVRIGADFPSRFLPFDMGPEKMNEVLLGERKFVVARRKLAFEQILLNVSSSPLDFVKCFHVASGNWQFVGLLLGGVQGIGIVAGIGIRFTNPDLLGQEFQIKG